MVIGAAVVVVLMTEGSYRRWKTERDAANAARQALTPKLELAFGEGDFGVEIIEGEPLVQTANVTVKNTGGIKLKECQVSVTLSSSVEGFVWKNQRFMVCAPVYLRIGEYEPVALFSLSFDERDADIRFAHCRQIVGQWTDSDHHDTGGRFRRVGGVYLGR